MDHLFSTRGVFDHPVTRLVVIVASAGLLLTPLIMALLGRRVSEPTRRDVRTRYLTWLALVPALLGPILLCPLAAMLLVMALSLLCYRDFARATGLFRLHRTSALVVLGVLGVAFANADHWYGLFVALPPLAMTLIAGAEVLRDAPGGYIQRVSLAVVGFLLFGAGLGHLGFIANDPGYRPVLCLVIFCTQASDIAAYVCGRSFGRRRLFPNTSPNKTLAGHVGALLVVAPLAAWLGHLVWRGTPLDTPLRLAGLGLIVAAGAQLGDLVLGSIKRDVGIKDVGATLPGHGGFLDRFNSLLLVAPGVFHYAGYFAWFGLDRPERVFSGGLP